MTLPRIRNLALFAFALLALEAGPLAANAPPPFPPTPKPAPIPPPALFDEGPNVPNVRPVDQPPPPPPKVDPLFPSDPPKPKRTGPFRSCGSGMGTGLAGIGLAWAMLWLGNRFVGRIARATKGDSAH